jgi:polysaccharide export outer membrane protein
MNRINYLLVPLILLAAAALPAQVSPDSAQPAAYVLGPEDQLVIRVVDIEEVTDKPFRIDMRGNINLPVVGRLHVGGLTVEQLETDLVARFEAVLQHPTVTVSVSEFRSQPVSVLGAVNTPGVHQIRGRKTLFEVISEAGDPCASSSIYIRGQK